MHDEFRILASAHTTAAAPLLPAAFGRAGTPTAANRDVFQRSEELRQYLRTVRRHLLLLAAFMAMVLLAGRWGGQATAGGPLALSLLFAFGGCVPGGLAAVRLHEAQAVLRAFGRRQRDPFEAAAGLPLWREVLAFGGGALAFAVLAYGLLA